MLEKTIAEDGIELQHLLVLHSIEGLGPSRLKRLFDFFGNFRAVWEAKISDFNQFKFPDKLIRNLRFAKKSLDPEEYFAKLQ